MIHEKTYKHVHLNVKRYNLLTPATHDLYQALGHALVYDAVALRAESTAAVFARLVGEKFLGAIQW